MRPKILIGAAAVAVVATVGAIAVPRDRESRVDAPATVTTASLAGPSAGGADVDAAIEQYRKATQINEREWSSWARLGLAYLAKSREAADPSFYDKADAAFRRSLDIEREDNFDAVFGMASLQASRHQFDDALHWARLGAKMRPDSADIRGIMGDALVELGRYGAAAETFQKMVDLRPALPSYARISYLSELHGNLAGARSAMRMALRAAGSPDDAAWALYHLGDIEFGEGRIGSALRLYERAAAIAPENNLGTAGRAKVAAARGDLATAIELMEKVVAGSGEPGYPALLAEYYAAAGRQADAGRALEVFRERETVESDNGTDTNLETSLLQADLGMEEEALKLAADEYSIRRSVQVADALGWALYVNGRYEEAARRSRESFRLGTRSALFHFHAGMIDRALGRTESAAFHLRTALDINPHFSVRHAATAATTLERLTP